MRSAMPFGRRHRAVARKVNPASHANSRGLDAVHEKGLTAENAEIADDAKMALRAKRS